MTKKEKGALYNREYGLLHWKNYYQATKERKLAKGKEYNLVNKEKQSIYGKEYYQDNQVQILADNKQYHKVNKEERIAYRKTSTAISNRLKQRCKKVGITVEYYDSLPKKCSFGHCTAIEAGGRGDWHMDHNHTTGKFRGLLCHNHNVLLGHAHDSPEELQDALDYLRNS